MGAEDALHKMRAKRSASASPSLRGIQPARSPLTVAVIGYGGHPLRTKARFEALSKVFSHPDMWAALVVAPFVERAKAKLLVEALGPYLSQQLNAIAAAFPNASLAFAN